MYKNGYNRINQIEETKAYAHIEKIKSESVIELCNELKYLYEELKKFENNDDKLNYFIYKFWDFIPCDKCTWNISMVWKTCDKCNGEKFIRKD